MTAKIIHSPSKPVEDFKTDGVTSLSPSKTEKKKESKDKKMCKTYTCLE